MKKTNLFLLLLTCIYSLNNLTAQNLTDTKEDHTYKPLKLNLNEDGSKYIRFIMWHQIWLTTNNLSNDTQNLNLNTSIRRSRFLAYSQVSPKFLILTHFGLNSLDTENLTSLGTFDNSSLEKKNDNAPQLFLHDAWGELKVTNNIYIGAGLHYWRGLTRLASQSTLNFMTLDQSRPFNAWHSLGVSDQFVRHMGLYLKGDVNHLEYRFAINNPIKNSSFTDDYSKYFRQDGSPASTLTYKGVSTPDSKGNTIGNTIFEGYVKYNFWENENTKLPFYVGTYLGEKKVLAVGGGFFLHPNGMYNTATTEHGDVTHIAADVFMELPTANGALNTYVAIQNFNYGKNYISRWGGTGTALYGQLGYFLKKYKLMPYTAISSSNYEGADDTISAIDMGVNYYINGHNCKITAEYHQISNDFRETKEMKLGGVDQFSQFRLQLHIFL